MDQQENLKKPLLLSLLTETTETDNEHDDDGHHQQKEKDNHPRGGGGGGGRRPLVGDSLLLPPSSCHNNKEFVLEEKQQRKNNGGGGRGVIIINDENNAVQEQVDSSKRMDDTVSFMPTTMTMTMMPTDIMVMNWENTPAHIQAQMIDNSKIHYVAIQLRCGVTAMCRANVLTCCPSVLRYMNQDIMQCLEHLPVSVHSLIRRTKIWINLFYSYGPKQEPRWLRHTTAHHHDAWLHW